MATIARRLGQYWPNIVLTERQFRRGFPRFSRWPAGQKSEFCPQKIVFAETGQKSPKASNFADDSRLVLIKIPVY
jgi:hypothetical protein